VTLQTLQTRGEALPDAASLAAGKEPVSNRE